MCANRVQTLRSSAPGVLPQTGTRQPGELWLNFADFALGFIDASQAAQRLLAVRWFVPTASYAVGDFVLYASNLYRAIAPSAAGGFIAANWSKVGTAADLTAMQAYVDAGDAARLPLVGGTLTGPLILAADPTAALGATTKQYVDTGVAAANANAALRVPLAGGTMTGALILSGAPTQPLQAATKAYVDSGAFLPIAGGTMLGPIVLAADPAAALQPATKQYVDGGRLGDNRIINGDTRIDQRNNGAQGTAAGVYTCDRWFYNATQTGHGTWQRTSGASIIGFPNWLAFSSTSAYVLVATDFFQFQHRIEADMVSDFAWGTPNAQPVTLSFWYASNTTGTFSGSIANDQGTRCYAFTFNIPTVNVFTRVVVTIPGDTGTPWVMSGNALGVVVRFDLGSGANFRGPAGAWTANNTVGVTGAVSIIATNGANMAITGVKLEVGSVATPFNHPPLAQALAACQRYYQVLGGGQVVCTGYTTAASSFYTCLPLPVQMRVAPSGVISGTSYSNASNLALSTTTSNMTVMSATATATGLGWAGGTIAFSAEL